MSEQPIKSSGILEDSEALWKELHRLSYDHLRIAALETQRAGQSLIKLIIAGIILALLLSATWLGLLTVAVLKLLEYGIIASTAILLAVIFNLLLALLLVFLIQHSSHYLRFPATVRSLKPTAEKETEKS
jgi:dolichyl-phosphate-mannose--protein O-mannosyl transferase